MTVQMLEASLRREEAALERRYGQAHAIAEQAKQYSQEAQQADNNAHLYSAACALLTQYADKRQSAIHDRLTTLVSQGLSQIFQEDLRLKINSKQVGKRVDTTFSLLTAYGDYEVETDILGARGGGVAAVTGFLLQTIMTLLTDSPRILFLDESFAQVSSEYEPRVADFLKELSDELDTQIVLVTHSTAYEDASDSVYRVSASQGVTSVAKVK